MKIETEFLKGQHPDQLFSILKQKDVQKVIDIRDSPAYSIYYRPKAFEALCSDQHIGYLYEKALGNPKSNREKYKNQPEEQRRVYLHLLDSEEDRKKAVQKLKTSILQEKQTICLICMCDVVDELGCHRFWLKKLLES